MAIFKGFFIHAIDLSGTSLALVIESVLAGCGWWFAPEELPAHEVQLFLGGRDEKDAQAVQFAGLVGPGRSCLAGFG